MGFEFGEILVLIGKLFLIGICGIGIYLIIESIKGSRAKKYAILTIMVFFLGFMTSILFNLTNKFYNFINYSIETQLWLIITGTVLGILTYVYLYDFGNEHGSPLDIGNILIIIVSSILSLIGVNLGISLFLNIGIDKTGELSELALAMGVAGLVFFIMSLITLYNMIQLYKTNILLQNKENI